MTLNYQIKVKELDDHTNYPILVLSGMTGLSQQTIHQLADQGKFPIDMTNGQEVVNGKQFKDWASSVGNIIEVEKTDYTLMKVDETP